jgi:hypothetical protein
MPFMQDWPYPTISRQASPGSDTSHTSGFRSPASGSTESTSVSGIQDARTCHKREAEPSVYLSRKKPRMDPLSTGRYTQSAIDGEVRRAMNKAAQEAKANSASSMKALSDSCAGLPALIWQSVFMHLPPHSLGKLLLVNRAFNRYLQAADGRQNSMDDWIQADGHLDPEMIWIQSRRKFHRHLPRPLHGRTELDMWKLIGGRRCQMCDQKKPGSKFQPGHSSESAIRGLEGQAVRIIWPLALRCCNACLINETYTVCPLL